MEYMVARPIVWPARLWVMLFISLTKLRDTVLDGSRGCTFKYSSLIFGAIIK